MFALATALIQGRNDMTRVRVELKPFDQGRRRNDAFTHSATLPTASHIICLKMLLGIIISLILVAIRPMNSESSLTCCNSKNISSAAATLLLGA